MISGIAALLTGFAAPSAAPMPDASLDLFVIARNPTPDHGFEWIDQKPEGEAVRKEAPIRRLMRPILQSLNARKVPFMIVDGGDCPLFRKGTEDQTVTYSQRRYGAYDAMTESETVRGKTRTRVLQRAETTTTQGGTLFPRRINGQRYSSRTFLYFDEAYEKSNAVMMFEDLNSYDFSHHGAISDDIQRRHGDRAVLVTDDSVLSAQEFIRDKKLPFDSVCFCPRGYAPDSAHFVTFPPADVVGHYRLYQENGLWRVQLLEYLRS